MVHCVFLFFLEKTCTNKMYHSAAFLRFPAKNDPRFPPKSGFFQIFQNLRFSWKILEAKGRNHDFSRFWRKSDFFLFLLFSKKRKS